MMMLSELQRKEVIYMETGEKLGFIDDVEIDEQTGYITGIIVVGRQAKGSFFQKPAETLIVWEQIMTIGTDIILIEEMKHQQFVTKEEDISD